MDAALERGVGRFEFAQGLYQRFEFFERGHEKAEVKAGFEILRHHRAIALYGIILVVGADMQGLMDRLDQPRLGFGQARQINDAVATRIVLAVGDKAIEIAIGQGQNLRFDQAHHLQQTRGELTFFGLAIMQRQMAHCQAWCGYRVRWAIGGHCRHSV